jgi:hypothetical protein
LLLSGEQYVLAIPSIRSIRYFMAYWAVISTVSNGTPRYATELNISRT